jgi:hypothetical protein
MATSAPVAREVDGEDAAPGGTGVLFMEPDGGHVRFLAACRAVSHARGSRHVPVTSTWLLRAMSMTMADRIDPLIAERAPWLVARTPMGALARPVLDRLLAHQRTVAIASALAPGRRPR